MEDSKITCGRLSACGLGGALGIFSALWIIVLGVVASVFKHGVAWVSLMSSLYVGFDVTPAGIAIGAAWAFVDGFICGAIIAWLYNAIVKRCPCKNCRAATH